ncbi:MAG TPA: VWA domain-containing protein, partial [Pseudomonadales bacterium]|nr:VWA domain-containing protein [Pseudomonadales bacterium]
RGMIPEFAWVWIFLLLPLPLLMRLLPPRTRREAALRVPDLHRFDGFDAASLTGSDRTRPRLILLWLMWLALITAAARPELIGDPVSVPVTGRDLMLAVDISGSMNREDMEIDGRTATRLMVVKDVLTEFIERRRGDRLGLILFGSNAYMQAPLTFDRTTVAALMDETPIGIAGGKTAIGDAIGLGVKHLRERPAENRVLILLTDGANNVGEMEPVKASELAAQAGVRIYTVGVGAERMQAPGWFGGAFGTQTMNPSADLDEDTLTKVAQLSGGRYFRARNRGELQAIYAALDELEPVPAPDEVFRPVKQLFHYPLAVAVLIGLLLALLQADWRRLGRRATPRGGNGNGDAPAAVQERKPGKRRSLLDVQAGAAREHVMRPCGRPFRADDGCLRSERFAIAPEGAPTGRVPTSTTSNAARALTTASPPCGRPFRADDLCLRSERFAIALEGAPTGRAPTATRFRAVRGLTTTMPPCGRPFRADGVCLRPERFAIAPEGAPTGRVPEPTRPSAARTLTTAMPPCGRPFRADGVGPRSERFAIAPEGAPTGRFPEPTRPSAARTL